MLFTSLLIPGKHLEPLIQTKQRRTYSQLRLTACAECVHLLPTLTSLSMAQMLVKPWHSQYSNGKTANV